VVQDFMDAVRYSADALSGVEGLLFEDMNFYH